MSFVERGSKRMLQEQMWIKAGIGFTDSKREDAYVEDSGRFVVQICKQNHSAVFFQPPI